MTTARFAVFGNPIAHSKSPYIHHAFAEQLGDTIDYQRILVEPGQFREMAARFFRDGGNGLNITVPFKLDAFAFADVHTPRARQAGAVNTLIPQPDGTVLGDNTDGAGLVSDMTRNLGWALRGKRVLLLGAGGAVRGVLGPIVATAPAAVTIANRTADKAETLAQDFTSVDVPVNGGGYGDLRHKRFDIVINGTSASLAGDLPPLPDTLLDKGACCYDMMYGREPTVFLQWAREHGAARLADGLGMLVEQAAESYFAWQKKRPRTEPVIAALRQSL